MPSFVLRRLGPHLLVGCCAHCHVVSALQPCLVSCVQSSLNHEAATEWSLLAEPLEAQLVTAGVVVGMGPRIAVVASLLQLAAAAGLLQQQPYPAGQHEAADSAVNSAGAGAHCTLGSVFTARAVSAGIGLWNTWMQVSTVQAGHALVQPH